MSIYISGSIAYDRIMNFPGKFSDSILADQVHNLNVSFFIDSLQENFGGNAGNIAYTLSLLGEFPIILATVGKDFQRYSERFTALGLSLEGIRRMEDVLTAGAYIITDQANNQITGFHAAAMMNECEYTFPHLDPENDIAIICPSNMVDMNKHAAFYREKKVRYIYDPAQQLPVTTKEQVIAAVEGAYLLAGNDYEIKLIMSMTGKSMKELASMTTRGIIMTLGEQGSMVISADGEEEKVAAVPVSNVVDPTGAGDAYRSGLIKGILLNQPLVEAARLGATCAAFCIEKKGPQGHAFSTDDFFQRHAATFGTPL